MADTSVNRTTGFGFAAFGATALANVKQAFARHAAYKRTFDELTHLSDRELADIGIARAMIHDIAVDEANRV